MIPPVCRRNNMPATEDIITAIEERVKDSNVVRYSLWSIGVSSTPKQCQSFFNYPPQFICWETPDEAAALAIRDLFLQKGMKNVSGGEDKRPRYVFIF
jgi:hypothetical protein